MHTSDTCCYPHDVEEKGTTSKHKIKRGRSELPLGQLWCLYVYASHALNSEIYRVY